MSDNMAYYVFGDQSLDSHTFLEDLCRRPEQGVLAKSFLEKAAKALRHEVDNLSTIARSQIPVFTTIQELTERYRDQQKKSNAIENALVCISQLAHYIDRAESVPEDLVKAWKASVIGLCTGQLAATAISIAPNLPVLVQVGVQIVLIAFRVGQYVSEMADRIYQSHRASEPWSYLVSQISADDVEKSIAAFIELNAISTVAKPYVSAVNIDSVTISGSPPALKQFFNTHLKGASKTPVSIYGPYNAPHLYLTADIERLLQLNGDQFSKILKKCAPRFAIVSSQSGKLHESTDVKDMLKDAVFSILNEMTDFKQVVESIVETAKTTGLSECFIFTYGQTTVGSTLSSALQQSGIDTQLKDTAYAKPVGKKGTVDRCKLAIVGMSGRFPDAASHEKLWELLEKGIDAHRVVPADRFPADTHVDPSGKARNTSHTPYGCWIENPGLFDPRFFNMSPREAYQTDPMQRMALTTAYEALEMAGYVPNRTRSTKLDRIGTFYGQTSDDWREINAAQDVDTYYITGGVRAFGPGRINYLMGFSGPSFNIDTACSSSAAALQLACTSLWAGDCDTAVVGGLSCMTNSDIFAGLSRGQFLSKKGPCATFDNDADGYCRADGCATVIVKRLEDALADKDNILATILGSATNHSADAISITHPHGGTQEKLYRQILDQAGVDPLDVSYVEMHGTGTQAGDGTEMKSVTNVFAPADRKRSRDQPLYLGAVKANVGHGEAASGVTALIKVLMMIQKNAIPPHVGIKNEMNKGFPKDLSERNVNIAFHSTPLPRKTSGPRRIFVNNFSAAGGNTGLLLEEGPQLQSDISDPRSTHVVAVTGKSKSALSNNAQRLLDFIDRNPGTSLSDLAYTTTARRIQHNWRVVVAASSLQDLKAELKSKINGTIVPAPHENPKAALLFTGQGSQYAALGKELFETSTLFRDTIIEFDKIAKLHGFPSFIPLIDGQEPDTQKLSPVVVQLGLCCFEMAMARLWASWGIKFDVVLGHSLGEYAALNVAGVLSASDTIFLVGKRAELLVDQCTAGTHSMLAVQGSVTSVTEALGDMATMVNVACINGPRETVLSGEAAEMQAATDQLNTAGLKCTQLKVPFAFHSAQVEPILDSFEKLAQSVTFHKAKTPVISPLLGRLLTENDEIDARYLRDHAREAVNFLGGLVDAQEASVIDEKTVWIEIGPHPICLGMVKAAFGAATTSAPSLRRSESPYKTLSTSLANLHIAGINIDWNEYHRDFLGALHLLDLPAYAFDEKNYWIQYENDWSLHKGRFTSGGTTFNEPAKPTFSTTSVHKIASESVKGEKAIVTSETDLLRDDLRPAVTGHVVNGTPLCPSSLYADMALTLADYAYKLVRPGITNVGANVSHMEVTKPLIADTKLVNQILTVVTNVDLERDEAMMVFSTSSGKSTNEHARCKIIYGKPEDWALEWQRSSYLIKSRIDWLVESEKKGIASKVARGLAYKLFAASVDYDRKYQGMEEVILHSENFEATSRVMFQTTEKDGNFMCSPYFIDSVAHLSGFIVNGSDATDSRSNCYISHGWESMRFSEMLSADKTYRGYVRMQDIGKKMLAGDVFVFHEDRIVGVVGGLKFQCIPRSLMNMLMPPVGAAKAAASPVRQKQEAPAPRPQKKKSETAQVSMRNLPSVNKKLVSITSQALDILAQEIGVSKDELDDSIVVADMGVDSLMSLSVSGRLREELELDIHSTMFVDYPTIGAFKKFLSEFEKNPAVSSDSSSSEEDISTPASDDGATSDITTPDEAISECSAGDMKDINGLSNTIKCTIAEEMGVEIEDVTSAANLADLGMDSLMSLSILGALREKTDLDLPSDLFVTNPNITAIEKALNIGPPAKPVRQSRQQPVVAMATSQFANDKPTPKTSSSTPERKASSVLLQGNQRTATKHLWIVPDGSGSATSYTEIAQIDHTCAVWGLNSPFMKTPEEYKCGVVGMASYFIAEIKRRQPQGPYMLAGWSAGGVIAFEAVNQLIKSGDIVSNLIIIDAPCPLTIEPLPASLHRWFASCGLLGDGDLSKLPTWLLPHFAASVTALSNYTAEKIDPTKCPKVMAIWCEDGVCKTPEDPRPDPYPTGHALFLLDNRSDFGPNLWDEYLDIGKFTTRHMPGNHFSMMKGDLAKQLGGFMREAVMEQ